MASLYKTARGYWAIQYDDRDRNRRTISLGTIPKRDAETIRMRVERLVEAKLLDRPVDNDTARWLTNVGDKLHGKLERFGLVETRHSAALGEFIDSYVATRTDAKASTKKSWATVHNSLRDYFGADCPLRSITKGKAKEWRLQLKTGKGEVLAPNTRNKRTAIAKALFNAALDHNLVDFNPFAKLPCAVSENPARDHYVTPSDAAKVLDKCGDQDWRTIFALCRWGGLRCPSEVLALRWGDILWDEGKMVVRSPKTAHIAGHAQRIVPLFPEVQDELNRAWDEAPEGAEFVVNKQRHATANFRTTMEKIITRAGLVPWPKLFLTLRASRATELADQYPSHVCAAWLGHTPKVADKFYRKVTAEHFRAAQKSAAQSAVHSAAHEGKSEQESKLENLVLQAFTSVYTDSLVREGLEPPTKGL